MLAAHGPRTSFGSGPVGIEAQLPSASESSGAPDFARFSEGKRPLPEFQKQQGCQEGVLQTGTGGLVPVEA